MTESGSVSFPISMEYPARQTYKVGQRITGSFRSITVGDRASDETEHMLEFDAGAGGGADCCDDGVRLRPIALR